MGLNIYPSRYTLLVGQILMDISPLYCFELSTPPVSTIVMYVHFDIYGIKITFFLILAWYS